MQGEKSIKNRQRWGSKLGVIMAVAGSAVGLGNFLRFPVQAANNGGGAFMIPYFIALLLVGIPLMWIEWTIGRYGGGFGHGTAPGVFHTLWQKNRFIKYFGVIGIFGPLVIFIYYTYIESWTLGYSIFALFKFYDVGNQEAMLSFLHSYQGLEKGCFHSILPAYIFFLITFGLNFFVVYYGIRSGIERLVKFAMPTLFIFAVIIMFRVLTLGANSNMPDWTIVNGLGFLWNPDLSILKDARVWLAASGQIFFTLSVGIGMILTYASYLSKSDDIVLSGLSAVSTNEICEVILGGSIIIPAAYMFFGPIQIRDIAQSGAFNLGFVTMPLILQKIPLSAFFGFLWFLMLFLAGITSSVSLSQPAIAFLEDEFNISRRKAILILGVLCFVFTQPIIFFLGRGVLSEMDFWGGTFCLVLFALIETVLFAWIFGIEKAWEEVHHGAELRVPKIYKFIIKYITPLYLGFILLCWFYQEGLAIFLMRGVPLEDRPYILGTRLALVSLFISLCILVRIAWKRRRAYAT